MGVKEKDHPVSASPGSPQITAETYFVLLRNIIPSFHIIGKGQNGQSTAIRAARVPRSCHYGPEYGTHGRRDAQTARTVRTTPPKKKDRQV